MRILVHEYICGGGLAGATLPAGLSAEGRLMLEGLLADFSALPGHEVLTTLDPRVSIPASLPVRVIPVREQLETVLEELVPQVDAALVVAPETGGLLARLTEIIERQGKVNLGSSSGAARTAGDKGLTGRLLLDGDLPVPRTLEVTFADDFLGQASEIGYPAVIKPRDGVGCSGVGLARDPSEMTALVEGLRGECSSFLIQEFVPGVPASASLVANGREAAALTLNLQEIEIGPRFVYRGGQVPLDDPLREPALRYAERACAAIPGLRGYVGVDLVLSKAGPTIIEINPRVTTAYIGLRRVLRDNPISLILKACMDGQLPRNVALSGVHQFSVKD